MIKKRWYIFMMNFRTDLALERRDLYRKANNIAEEVDGIQTQEEDFGESIHITKVTVLNENGEQAIGKKKGHYITIDIKNLKIAGEDEIQKASEAVTKELKQLISQLVANLDDILVVGLGNLYVTPDALGPKVIQDIDVTRHIFNKLVDFLWCYNKIVICWLQYVFNHLVFIFFLQLI